MIVASGKRKRRRLRFAKDEVARRGAVKQRLQVTLLVGDPSSLVQPGRLP